MIQYWRMRKPSKKNLQKCFTHEYQVLSDFFQKILRYGAVLCVFSHSTNRLAGGVPFAVPNNLLSSLSQRVSFEGGASGDWYRWGSTTSYRGNACSSKRSGGLFTSIPHSEFLQAFKAPLSRPLPRRILFLFVVIDLGSTKKWDRGIWNT